MRVVFCGVRGSTCALGIEFVRYGGHTSCVALAHDGEPPTLVLDAGTGLRNLTRHLDGQPFRGTILLGHLHWDHTHGLPFFAAGPRRARRLPRERPGPGPGGRPARARRPAHGRRVRSQELPGPRRREYAVGLAEAAGGRTLVLFHHDPARTDDEIDALVVAHGGGTVEVIGAAEGLMIDL